MQTSWPCECNKWQIAPICEGVFQTHAWSSIYARVRLCVPFCDGVPNLGHAQAWGGLACLIIQGHHESERLFGCGMGRKIRIQKGKKILSQEGTPWRGMDSKARLVERGKHKQFQGSGFKPKKTFVKNWVLFMRANPRGMLVGSPNEHVSIVMKCGITPKIASNPNRGVGVPR